ncbi:MAG: TA system VapC family ribonuclease toxin [Nocardioides sp.]
MKVVDANVLISAVNLSAPQHLIAKSWLERALSGGAVVGFAWQPLLAFIRIVTRPGLLPQPMSAPAAAGWIDDWLSCEPARILIPGDNHAALMTELLLPLGVAGNLVNDAHLAALAMQHKATVVSFDRDFGRFGGVRWEPPTMES